MFIYIFFTADEDILKENLLQELLNTLSWNISLYHIAIQKSDEQSRILLKKNIDHILIVIEILKNTSSENNE